MLHRVHDGKLEAVSDIVQTAGFYDDRRIRVHSPDLYRAYELLYFRDERRLTPEILRIVGFQGLAALWCDTGLLVKDKVILRSWANAEETQYLSDWAIDLGFRPSLAQKGRLEFSGAIASDLAYSLRRAIPRSKMSTLRR